MSPAYSLHAAWQVGPDPVHHMVKLKVSQAEGTAHPRARDVSSVWLSPKEWLDRWGGVEDGKITSGIPRFVCMPVWRYAGLCRLSGQGVLLSLSTLFQRVVSYATGSSASNQLRPAPRPADVCGHI